jgi:hypothetical protein
VRGLCPHGREDSDSLLLAILRLVVVTWKKPALEFDRADPRFTIALPARQMPSVATFLVDICFFVKHGRIPPELEEVK